MSIEVLIADDHELVRERVRALLRDNPEIHIIGEAENGREALDLARRLEPDVVVMDISMPQLNGLDALSKLSRQVPKTRVVLLSMYVHPSLVRRAYMDGAAAYVLKQSVVRDLETAVSAAYAGNRFFSVEHETSIPDNGEDAFVSLS